MFRNLLLFHKISLHFVSPRIKIAELDMVQIVLRGSTVELMTSREVARCLKISVRTVYNNKNRLGGFYPAGLGILRFREDLIYGIMEGQNTQGLEIQLPVSGKGLRRGRPSNQSRSQKGKGRSKSRGPKEYTKTNPARHGL